MENKIKGGMADGKTINDIAKKHKVDADLIKIQVENGIEVEMEHTKDKKKAREIAMDHLMEFPDYYTRLKKMERQGKKAIEPKESMGADSSGSYEAPFTGTILKKDIHKIHNWKTKQKDVKESMDAGVSAGAMYDGPIGTAGPSSPMDKTKKKRKDPLKIDNAESKMGGASITGASTKNMIATKKGFPRFGGPEGKFVEINDKCKTFPYCDQGASSDKGFKDRPSPIQLKEAINEAAKKYGISENEIAKLVSEALPAGIDFDPALKWGREEKGENFVYSLTTTEPLTIITTDEVKFEKLKLSLRNNNVKFNETKRPLSDIKDITMDTSVSSDNDDDETIWPEEDDDMFANTK